MEKANNINDYFRDMETNDDIFAKECETEYELYQMAKLLQDYRKNLKMSQEEIANKSGLTRQMVSKIETYSTTPTISTLMKYFKAIDLNFIDIVKESINRR